MKTSFETSVIAHISKGREVVTGQIDGSDVLDTRSTDLNNLTPLMVHTLIMAAERAKDYGKPGYRPLDCNTPSTCIDYRIDDGTDPDGEYSETVVVFYKTNPGICYVDTMEVYWSLLDAFIQSLNELWDELNRVLRLFAQEGGES